jgi:hypothetical protein
MIAPALTGFVVGKTGQFLWAFAVCSAVVLAGAASYAFLLGRVEPVQWGRRGGQSCPDRSANNP